MWWLLQPACTRPSDVLFFSLTRRRMAVSFYSSNIERESIGFFFYGAFLFAPSHLSISAFFKSVYGAFRSSDVSAIHFPYETGIRREDVAHTLPRITPQSSFVVFFFLKDWLESFQSNPKQSIWAKQGWKKRLSTLISPSYWRKCIVPLLG
jgi:hypothetical protein